MFEKDINTNETITEQETLVEEETKKSDFNIEEELSKQKEYYLRIVADCEDRMRRCKQDAVHSINLALENITRDLIPLMSDITQALAICDGQTKIGLEMIEKNLKNTLKKYGVEEIQAEIGQEFDPNIHHAISTEEKEGMDEGKITNIVQRGYKLNNKVINATMVVVSK